VTGIFYDEAYIMLAGKRKTSLNVKLVSDVDVITRDAALLALLSERDGRV
jgi:hypothetical protein